MQLPRVDKLIIPFKSALLLTNEYEIEKRCPSLNCSFFSLFFFFSLSLYN